MRLRKLMAVLLVLSMALGIMPAALASGIERFTDFPTGWSAPAMTAAVQNGLLVGVSDNEIKPEDNLTRAEFATIIARAFGAETVADISNFTDVSESEWYYNYIAKAVKMEVLKGKSASKMDPDAFITREEVFTALARVLVLSSDDSSSLNRFYDKSSISDWAIPELTEMSARGYVNGDETGNLNPKANITREEFAQVMYNTIKTYITSTGVYSGDFEGIVVARTGNVTFKNASINGDLVIGDGAGVGAINIEKTNITGRLLTRGGTMTLKNFKIGQNLVVVKNVNGVTKFNNYRSEFKEVIEHTPAKFLTKNGGSVTGSPGIGSSGYTITWLNHDGTELEKDLNVPYGATPTYDGAAPTKPSTAQYDYTFSGWTPAVSSVTGEATYTATFTETLRKYTITWLNHDGTELEKDLNVPYGTMPTYDGAAPTKPPTAQYEYTFNGWTPVVSAVESEATYTATFTEALRKYTITWLNHDGTELEKDLNVPYGATPTYDGAAPTKPPTAQYEYTFNGWTPAVSSVTGEATYTATFTATLRKYTITWKNYDDTTLDTDEVEYGVMPVYSGLTPIKLSDRYYNYTFGGWLPGVVNVVNDAIYTATYNQTAIEYSIQYKYETGNLSLSIDGTDVEFIPTAPARTTRYTVEDTVNLPALTDVVVPTGYKIEGWYYADDLSLALSGTSFTGIIPESGDTLTLYAHVVEKDKITVKFDLGYNNLIHATPAVLPGWNLGQLMPQDPTRPGYDFGGWYIDGVTDPIDENYVFNYAEGATVVVRAKWDGQLYTVRFIQGAAELKRIENIPYNTKLDDASYWAGLPDAPKETIYTKLSSYSDFVYYDDTPFQVADVYYYQKDDGEWARFDETVAVTKNIDAYLMDKRFSMTVKIPSRSTPVGPDTPYVPGETRLMDSLKSILENGSAVLNVLEDTDIFKKAQNKLTQQLIDKDIVVKHANGDLEIKITEIPVNITRFISADRVKSVIKQYITDMVNDPAKLDSMLNMIDIDTLVNQIGTSTLVGKLTDAKIVELMKKEENRTTVINGVYSALGNASMQSVIISYLTERIENDEDFCNTIAEEFKAELASDPTLRAEILGDAALLNSVLGQANMKALVADVILGDDVLEIAVSDPTFKSTLIEKMAGNATVREKVSQTSLFTSYVLTKIKADDTLKDKIREKLVTDASLRETIITNSDLLNLFLDDSTLKSTIISSAVDNNLFISKIISNDGLKQIIIDNMSDNQDFIELLLHTEAFAEFIDTALHDQNSPFKTHVLELLEEDSVKADMHEIIKSNDDFRAELASDELKDQVMDAIDEYISHGNIDDLVAYIWHRTLGDTYTGGREADYQNFITDAMVDELKDILFDHKPAEAIGWSPQEFFDYLTSNADARDDVKASADADVRAKINTELTQYKEDVLADFIANGVITNPDGTENLDIESKIDDAVLEIIKNYIITETTGNADADAHIEHEMVEYTKDIVLNEPDALHQDLVAHIEDIKQDFKASIIDIDNDILIQSIIDFRDDSQSNKTILTGVINDNFASITDYIKQNVAGDDELKGTISDMIADFANSLSNDLINTLIEKIGDGHNVISTIVAEYIDGLSADELKAEINAFVVATSDADILDMVQELRDDTTLGLKGIIQGDDIYSEIKGYLVDNIGNGTISSKVDNVLKTKASNIDTAVVSDLIIKLLNDTENSDMVTNYLTKYISNSEKETTVKGYINGFIESDSLNEQFIRENRQLIEDIINSIDISGLITNDLVKDYINGLTPAEKQEFISDVYGAVLELDYVDEFIYAFETKASSFEINKDNLAFVKAIADGVDAFTYDTVIQYISFKGFDRIEQLLGDRFLEPLFNRAKADYVTRLNDAIAEVEADNNKVVDYSTSMVFKVDIINDVLAKLYEKATEKAVKAVNRIDGIRYNENDYLYSLLEYKDLLREDLLEHSTHGSDPELTGWILRTPTEYYDVALGKVILLDDAICWYGDTLTEEQIDSMIASVIGRGFDVHDRINGIISDYDLYHELPDTVQKVIDRVSQLNSFITKYQSQIDAMVDKYLSSGLNQKFEEDDVMNKDKVDTMIDIIFGTEDEPVFNIDTVYLLLDKANVKLRGRVHQKLLDNESRVQNAIERFESTDIGTLLSGIGNSKVTSAAEKAQEFLTTGKIRSAYDNVYDILLHITDPEIGPDAFSFTVDDPTIKGVDDAYKFSIRGIEFKFMRYYK